MFGELFRIDKIFSACEKICYLFLVNFVFLLSCFPVILFLLFVGISQVRDCLPLFLTAALSIPPALSALFFAMTRLVEGRESRAFKDYFKGYKEDWKQKMIIGAIQMLAIFILWTNIEFFTLQVPALPLAILFIILFAYVIIITPQLYLLTSRYRMKTLELLKTAAIVTVAKPGYTLGNIAAFLLLLAAFELSPGTTVLFMGAIYGFLVAFMNKKLLKYLEKSQ